ncbi:putative glycosyltransferase (TIGR04348 family) [Sulfuritortus calidifontis]|uniref:Putative glycosyltransferase (TIGR04348 family) n=1 Tax=Sulfuritortus calidifontis TaxID=1914471 RepID=A0A4R3JXN0_9PROT|nr:selenoneine biosynthesis selenosugar synthase SenB [Sulfuritortus calidifontis]TCS73259.1 putative glycosyltransferase (TIGR04348 family) [Sulfuritortus calidifontis]
MRIALITPYLPAARNGNAHTAVRWARCLRAAGHRVRLALEWDGRAADLMVALHARRSAASIRRFAEAYPDRPLIVLLTGTDLYRDIQVDIPAQASLRLATRLVVLQERGLDELAPGLQAKARVIYQSAPRLQPAPRAKRHFEVGVVAHLREEKDPLRAAHAAARLPADSRIRVRHVGQALGPEWAAQAEQCAQAIPRWHWLGPRSHGETRRLIARSHLLVNSSRMEGGAFVLIEAITAGVPVLATRIPGNVGMLGVDYAGYFPVGDTAALAALMRRAETEPDFYARLQQQCAARAPLFEPARECAEIERLIDEVT